MTEVLLAVVAVTVAGLAVPTAVAAARRSRSRSRPPAGERILFPFVGQALSRPALDATLRLARAEGATLVPAYLARVPLALPLAAPIAAECAGAMPLLEAIEHRALRSGVAVDARIERGRTYRHALRELLAHESYDRIVVAADAAGVEGFGAADVAWLLEHAAGELLVLRPGRGDLHEILMPDEPILTPP